MFPFFLQFIKPLFPSWKFFDECTDTPVLLYKYLDEEKWKITVEIPNRHWWNFIWNPKGNYYLAYHSHMQQLMGDLTEFDEEKIDQFYKHISYKITENFVRSKNPIRPFHFKVSSIKRTNQGFTIVEDILLSRELRP